MNLKTRRLALQLTPLLDLLLIVIFAQYMEMRVVARKETERAETKRKAVEADLDSIQKQLAALQRQLSTWEDQRRDTENAEHSSRAEIGEIVGELFRIPEATLNKIANRRSADAAVLSEAELAALKAEFKSLANSRPDQIVDHILTFSEMKKRFDVWELYIENDDFLRVKVGPHLKRLSPAEIETPDLFCDGFFKLYKSFPQSKNIVLILVSYGDAQLQQRWAITKGLPTVCERMRQDSNGTVKFEYAVLGFRPESNRKP